MMPFCRNATTALHGIFITVWKISCRCLLMYSVRSYYCPEQIMQIIPIVSSENAQICWPLDVGTLGTGLAGCIQSISKANYWVYDFVFHVYIIFCWRKLVPHYTNCNNSSLSHRQTMRQPTHLLATTKESRIRDGIIEIWTEEVWSQTFWWFIRHLYTWTRQNSTCESCNKTHRQTSRQTLNECMFLPNLTITSTYLYQTRCNVTSTCWYQTRCTY